MSEDNDTRDGVWPWFKELIEVLAKVAVPVVVVWVGWHVQQGLSTSQLLNQREQSDTTIRAELFKALSDKVFRDPGGKPGPEQRAVFAELLALNFHQHIELKPLMLDIDQQLYDQRKHEDISGLRSVSRRIRDRQVQLLTRASTHDRPPIPGDSPVPARLGTVDYLAVQDSGQPPVGNRPTVRSACEISPRDGVNVMRSDPVFFALPSGQGLLSVAVNALDFDRETIRIALRNVSAAELQPQLPPAGADTSDEGVSLESRAMEFTTTWYDFPMTDSTLMKSGLRYAFFVDRVCPKERVVRLGVLWFPENFVPAFERPVSNKEILERLNLGK
jgi:hypothetical protein